MVSKQANKLNRFKILFYDLETEPHEGLVWAKHQTDVIRFTRYGNVLCFAYKWQGDRKVTFVKARSLKSLMQKLRKLFKEADIVVAHNHAKFDLKVAMTMMAKCGLKPFPMPAAVDTLQLYRRSFKLPSYRLDDICDYFGLGKKVKTPGIDLWIGCMKNDKKSWKLMEKYNKQDVVLLEKVYNFAKAWDEKHPMLSVLSHKKGCGCGSTNYMKKGFRATQSGRKQRYICKDCGRQWAVPANKGLKWDE